MDTLGCRDNSALSGEDDMSRGDDYEMTVEYVDYAEYYDFDHAITLDIGFYLNLARQCGSPILELACGVTLLRQTASIFSEISTP